MAKGTVGTSFWNDPANIALGVGNLAIDAGRLVFEEDKRKEALDTVRALGTGSAKALGLLKY